MANGFTTAFSKDSPTQLVRKGLYSKIRHPFYMTYLLSYFSLAIGLLDFRITIVSLVMFYVYISAAKFEENKFLNTNLKDHYLAYKKQAGMFFPKLIIKR